MDSGEVGLVVQLAALGLEVVDPVELVRPRDAIAGDVPFPAADVCEGLRLGEPHRRLAERLGGVVALRDRGAEREQADGGDGEEALDDLHCHRLVAAAERHVLRDHAGHAERGHREARRHRAELREADGRPEEEREEEVGVAPEPAEEDERREAGERREHDGALGEAPCRDPKGRTRRPDQDQRCDEQGSRGVAEPPEDPARSVGRRGRRVRERQHGDAVRRRHRGRDGRGAGEPDHVLNALEGFPEREPAEQVDGHERLERVPDCDAGRDPERDAARRVAEQGADRDRGPDPRTEEQQRCYRDPGGRPDWRYDAVSDRQIETELRSSEVDGGDESNLEDVRGSARPHGSRIVRQGPSSRAARAVSFSLRRRRRGDPSSGRSCCSARASA